MRRIQGIKYTPKKIGTKNQKTKTRERNKRCKMKFHKKKKKNKRGEAIAGKNV